MVCENVISTRHANGTVVIYYMDMVVCFIIDGSNDFTLITH